MNRNPLTLGLVAVGLIGAVACGAARGTATSFRPGGPAASSASPALAAPARADLDPAFAAPGASAALGTADARRASTVSPARTTSSCPTGPTRRAFAEEIGAAGTVTWQVRLPTDPNQQGIALRPLVIGRTAVFAEENAVYALRRGDGHQMWKRVFPKIKTDLFASMVYGLWQWRGSVIELVGQVSAHSRLYSLNSATGAVNWTLPLGKQGELGSQALTGDGGLAMIRGQATLTVVDLATGRIRWARTGVNSDGPVAVGGVLIAATSHKIHGFSPRTGKLLWTRTGMPEEPSLLVSAGRLIVFDDNQDVSPPVPLWPVTALSPATGRTLWRTGTGTALFSQSAGPSGVAVVNSGRQLIMINAATGHVRWRVHDADSQLPADTGTDVFFVNESPTGGKLSLVDVRAASGSVRWSVPVPGIFNGQVFAFGGHAMAFEDSSNAAHPPGVLVAFRLTTGARAWSVKIPSLLQVPPAVAGSDLLLQPTDPGIACPVDGSAATVGTAVGTAVAGSGAGSSG